MPFDKLREYNGQGKFEFKMEELVEVEADFKLIFYSNAKAILQTSFFLSPTTAPIFNENKKGLFDISLHGNVSIPRGSILIEKLFISNLNLRMDEGKPVTLTLELLCNSTINISFSDEESEKIVIHYGLTNFVFSGCAYSKIGDRLFLDKFNAEVNGLNFLFKKVKGYKEVEERLKNKKGTLLTSEAVVEVSASELDKTSSTIFEIIELLSLATRNLVSPIYEDHYCDGKLVKTTLNPVLTLAYRPGDYLININSLKPCALKIYLECVYKKYKEYKELLKLNRIIHFYLISRYAVFSESKFLLGVVALESLCSNFADFMDGEGKAIKPSLIGKTKKDIKRILKDRKSVV